MGRTSVLVTGEWVEQHIDTDGVVLVETGNEDTEYRKGHIPGAVWIGWSEFQDSLRLGVVDREGFEGLLRAKGISNGDTVVVHSSNSNLLAALVHWYFVLYGHRSVKLLDGGRRRWELDGRPLTTKIPQRPVTGYRTADPDPSVRALRDDVVAGIGNKNIIDVRTPEEYSGRVFAPGFAGAAFAPGNNPHEVAQRSGHVPGALNIGWEAVVNPDGTFRSDRELRRLYSGLSPANGTITYCWVGARSAHTWFVLRELLGWPDVRNYDGSWAEYGSGAGGPPARGPGGSPGPPAPRPPPPPPASPSAPHPDSRERSGAGPSRGRLHHTHGQGREDREGAASRRHGAPEPAARQGRAGDRRQFRDR